MPNSHYYALILAGGTGTRLWPVSTEEKPKQFIDFFGTGRSLLQQTFDRMAQFIPHDHIYISTFEEYADTVRDQLPLLPEAQILTEPVQLSTAPATAWGALHIAQTDPNAAIVVSPCDQLIIDHSRFVEEVQVGLDFVKHHDAFLAMGVKATAPNTAYGYIQVGEPVAPHLYNVQSFSEKPDASFAELFVKSGEFLWNTGLFLLHAATINKLLLDIVPQLKEMPELTKRQASETNSDRLRRLYAASSRQSIDLLILEGHTQVYVQECSFGWADIGCWPALHTVATKDADGNAILSGGKVKLSNASHNVVRVNPDTTALINGLEGFIVAQEGNNLVICPNDDPTRVRNMLVQQGKTLEVRR